MAPLLTRVSVLDLSVWRPGPYATSLLAALGADVLKVEPPGGDPMRRFPELFESVNRGKRSLMLDLKRSDDRKRALELALAADVVVEGFRPGVISRLGLDEPAVRSINPRSVYCSISGYGQVGWRARVPGHDINYQAWAGALAPDGGRAAMPPLPLADLASGMAAAFGICAALLGRNNEGQGAYLDISMTDVMATWTGSATAFFDPGPGSGGRSGADISGAGPPAVAPVPGYGLFDTADGGQVALGIVDEQHFWSALCVELELDSLAGLSFGERRQRGDELTGSVAEAIRARTRDELVSSLQAAGIPVAPVLDRPTLVATPFSIPAFPIRLGGPATEVSGLPPAPTLDQHHGQGFRRAPGHDRGGHMDPR